MSFLIGSEELYKIYLEVFNKVAAVVVNNEIKEKFDTTLNEVMIKHIEDISSIEVDKELNIVSFEVLGDKEYMNIDNCISRELTPVEHMMYEPIRLFNSIEDVDTKVNKYILNDIYDKSRNMVTMRIGKLKEIY